MSSMTHIAYGRVIAEVLGPAMAHMPNVDACDLVVVVANHAGNYAQLQAYLRLEWGLPLTDEQAQRLVEERDA